MDRYLNGKVLIDIVNMQSKDTSRSIDRLHLTSLTTIFDETGTRKRLSLAESCAQRVHAGTFPLSVIKYGGWRTNTVSHFLESNNFDSTKERNVFVKKNIKGKLYNFEAYLCGLLYSTFKTSF